jgi:hypothetical protein
MGWSTTPNGTVEYSDGQSVRNIPLSEGRNATLYAVWNIR